MGTPELRGINREQGFEAKPDISPTIRAILRTRTHPLDLPRTESPEQILCHLGMEMEQKFLAYSMIAKMEFYGLETETRFICRKWKWYPFFENGNENKTRFSCEIYVETKTKQDFPAM
jgi:hypothetical protein